VVQQRGKSLVICGEFRGGSWTEDDVFLSAENFPRFLNLFSNELWIFSLAVAISQIV
jgi:hypothetical protein